MDTTQTGTLVDGNLGRDDIFDRIVLRVLREQDGQKMRVADLVTRCQISRGWYGILVALANDGRIESDRESKSQPFHDDTLVWLPPHPSQ